MSIEKTSVTISRAEVLKILTIKDPVGARLMLLLLIKSKKPNEMKDGHIKMSIQEVCRRIGNWNTMRIYDHFRTMSKAGWFTFEETKDVIPVPKLSKPLVFEYLLFDVTFLTEEEMNSEDHQLTMELDTTAKPLTEREIISRISNGEQW